MTEDRFEALRTAVLRFMSESHLDWREVHEGEMAKLLDVEPGVAAFTWKWSEAADRNEEARRAQAEPGDW